MNLLQLVLDTDPNILLSKLHSSRIPMKAIRDMIRRLFEEERRRSGSTKILVVISKLLEATQEHQKMVEGLKASLFKEAVLNLLNEGGNIAKADEIVEIFSNEVRRLSPKFAVTVVNTYLKRLKEIVEIDSGDKMNGKGGILSLLPGLLSIIQENTALTIVVTEKKQLSGSEYIDYFVHSVCGLDLPIGLVVEIASIWSEIFPKLGGEIQLELVTKLLQELERVDRNDISHYIYKILTFANAKTSGQIIASCIRYFNDIDAMIKNMEDLDKAEEILLMHIEGTTLLHFNLTTQQNIAFGRAISQYLKSISPLDLSEFVISLFFSISRIGGYEGHLSSLVSVIVNYMRASYLIETSSWLSRSSFPIIDVPSMVLAAVEKSQYDWDHLAQSIVTFGFDLMSTKTPQVQMQSKKLSRVNTQLHELGMRVLKECYEIHEMLRSFILDTTTRLIGKSPEAIDLLTYLINSNALDLSESGGAKIMEICLPFLGNIDVAHSMKLIVALSPLIATTKEVETATFLHLRKAAFGKGDRGRLFSLLGSIELMIALRSRTGSSELLSIVGRSFLHHSFSIRTQLYNIISYLSWENHPLSISLYDLVTNHLEKYLDKRDISSLLKGASEEQEPITPLLSAYFSCIMDKLRNASKVDSDEFSTVFVFVREAVAALATSIKANPGEATIISEAETVKELASFLAVSSLSVWARHKEFAKNFFSLDNVEKFFEEAVFIHNTLKNGQGDVAVAHSATMRGPGGGESRSFDYLSVSLCEILFSATSWDQNMTMRWSGSFDANMFCLRYIAENLNYLLGGTLYFPHLEKRVGIMKRFGSFFFSAGCEFIKRKRIGEGTPCSTTCALGLVDLLTKVVLFCGERMELGEFQEVVSECINTRDSESLGEEMEKGGNAASRPSRSYDHGHLLLRSFSIVFDQVLEIYNHMHDIKAATSFLKLANAILFPLRAESISSTCQVEIEKLCDATDGITTELASSEKQGTAFGHAHLQLVMMLREMRGKTLDMLKEMARALFYACGSFHSQNTVSGLQFPLIGDNNTTKGSTILIQQVRSVLEILSFLIGRKVATTEYYFNLENDMLKVAQLFSVIVNIALPINTGESMFEIYLKFFSVLSTMAKACIARKYPSGTFQNITEEVAQNITPKIYLFFNYITESTGNEVETKRKSKRRIVKQYKYIPNLVFTIERYEQQLIQLSSLSSVDLTKSLKRSTSRDFRIDVRKLMTSEDTMQIVKVIFWRRWPEVSIELIELTQAPKYLLEEKKGVILGFRKIFGIQFEITRNMNITESLGNDSDLDINYSLIPSRTIHCIWDCFLPFDCLLYALNG